MNIENSGFEENDVFEIFSDEKFLKTTGKIYRFEPLLKAIHEMDSQISKSINEYLKGRKFDLLDELLHQGVICKILRAESPGWKQGRLRLKVQIHLDFIPEVPDEVAENESQDNSNHAELDELRQIS